MKKSYKIIGVLILIVCILIGFSTVKNKKVEYAIELANNYLLEEKYEEAVLVFEDLPVIYENRKYKEAYVVVSTIRDADELINSGKYEEAQNLLEGIKDNNIFEVTDKVVEKIELNIYIEKENRGLGNSLQNSMNGGLVAYEGDMVYFSNVEDGGKLYRKNLKTDETVKISDEIASQINIYEDKIYYNNSKNIVCISKDGTGTSKDVIEPILGEFTRKSYYIVDDNIFYLRHPGGNGYVWGIERFNLKTGEHYKTNSYIRWGDWVVDKKDDGNLDMYYSYWDSMIKLSDANSRNIVQQDFKIASEGSSLGHYFDILGVCNGELYHTGIGINEYNGKNGRKRIFKMNTKTGKSKQIAYLGDDFDYSTKIIGDKYLYLISDDGVVYSVNLETGDLNKIKTIDKLKREVDGSNNVEYSDEVFEIKGYLAYYNSSGKLIIDKDIQVREINNKKEETPKKSDTIKYEYKSISTKEEALDLIKKADGVRLNKTLNFYSDNEEIECNLKFIGEKDVIENTNLISLNDNSTMTIKNAFYYSMSLSKDGEGLNDEYIYGVNKETGQVFIIGPLGTAIYEVYNNIIVNTYVIKNLGGEPDWIDRFDNRLMLG